MCPSCRRPPLPYKNPRYAPENCVECDANHSDLQELFDTKCNKIKSKRVLEDLTNSTPTPKLPKQKRAKFNASSVPKCHLQTMEKNFKKKCEEVMCRDDKDVTKTGRIVFWNLANRPKAYS